MMLTRTKRGVVRAAQGAVAYVGRDTVPLRAAAVDSPCGSFATSWTPGILGRRMPGSGSTQPGVCSGGQQGHVGFAVGGYAAAGVHTGAAQLNADDALWLEELVELLATTRGGGDGLRVLCDSAKQQTTLKSILQVSDQWRSALRCPAGGAPRGNPAGRGHARQPCTPPGGSRAWWCALARVVCVGSVGLV